MIDAPVRPATLTERKIAEMLLENTGAAMMDSGGIYGRAWQTTRAKYGLDGGLPNSTFHGGPGHPVAEPEQDEIERVALAMRSEPEGYIDDFGTVIVRAFHWLTARLDYDPALDAKYQRFTRVTNYGKDLYDKDWGLPVAERFMELLAKRGGFSDGIYPGERPGFHSEWVNTYNGDDALDRTLQFALFHVEDDGRGKWIGDEWSDPPEPFLPGGSYVLLQIHGGADVRGGYTDPVLFIVNGEQSDLFDNDRIEVYCAGADVLPDGVAAGQMGIDGSVVEPTFVNHRWDNSYGDARLRLTYNSGEDLAWWGPGKDEHVLVFPYGDDDLDKLREEGVQIEYGYTAPDGKVVRPAVYGKADIATRDDDGAWRCPYDGSILHAMGAIAS